MNPPLHPGAEEDPMTGSSSQRSLLLEPAVAGSTSMCPPRAESDPRRVGLPLPVLESSRQLGSGVKSVE